MKYIYNPEDDLHIYNVENDVVYLKYRAYFQTMFLIIKS